MTENLREYDRTLPRYKSTHRKAKGATRLKRCEDMPIAALVPKVVLGKRLAVERLVAGRIPRLASSIESQIRGLG